MCVMRHKCKTDLFRCVMNIEMKAGHGDLNYTTHLENFTSTLRKIEPKTKLENILNQNFPDIVMPCLEHAIIATNAKIMSRSHKNS